MFYRILSADDSVRADEKLVKTDTVTGTALVSRDTLPEADEALRNKFVFDSGDVSADLLFRSAFEFMESGDCECASIKDVPIWIAHAANDGIVSIAHDDLAAKKLTELNVSFRYTRSEKYGHFLAARFLLKENWCDWMFQQNKDC